jgi:excisionase family DNA binding protein
MAMPAQFLTVAEVATHMRVSGMTIYRLIRSGELRAVRVGHSYRVPREALDEYLAASVRWLDQRDARGA